MMPKSPKSHLDPRQPLVVDTTKLPRQPGATRALKRVVPAPPDLGLELISVPKDSDLELDLSLTSVSEGVYVSGTVLGTLTGECGRCLGDITESFDVEIAELFAYAASTTEETTDEDEVGRMHGDLIDLEPAVRDAIVLTLPTNPLCAPWRQVRPGSVATVDQPLMAMTNRPRPSGSASSTGDRSFKACQMSA